MYVYCVYNTAMTPAWRGVAFVVLRPLSCRVSHVLFVPAAVNVVIGKRNTTNPVSTSINEPQNPFEYSPRAGQSTATMISRWNDTVVFPTVRPHRVIRTWSYHPVRTWRVSNASCPVRNRPSVPSARRPCHPNVSTSGYIDGDANCGNGPKRWPP